MFVLLKKMDGKRLLVNLDLTFCFEEGESGEAIAVSIFGAAVPAQETFDNLLQSVLEAKR